MFCFEIFKSNENDHNYVKEKSKIIIYIFYSAIWLVSILKVFHLNDSLTNNLILRNKFMSDKSREFINVYLTNLDF